MLIKVPFIPTKDVPGKHIWPLLESICTLHSWYNTR